MLREDGHEVSALKNGACNGAITGSIGSQASLIDKDTDMVLLTIGGNDVGFDQSCSMQIISRPGLLACFGARVAEMANYVTGIEWIGVYVQWWCHSLIDRAAEHVIFGGSIANGGLPNLPAGRQTNAPTRGARSSSCHGLCGSASLDNPRRMLLR
ncbi:MAG: hypothetical protein L0Z63_02770 [Actinobacteria bacterium]|nr:hypothetical protein [Actinomycetota bacterium]